MKHVTINTYTDSFTVSNAWLNRYIEEHDIDDFWDTYTWDDGEWIRLLYKAEQAEKEIHYLTQKLKQGYSLFKNGKKEGILHVSSKGQGYQFSYFDAYGPIGDIQKNTLYEMARSIYQYGFKLCIKEDLTIIK